MAGVDPPFSCGWAALLALFALLRALSTTPWPVLRNRSSTAHTPSTQGTESIRSVTSAIRDSIELVGENAKVFQCDGGLDVRNDRQEKRSADVYQAIDGLARFPVRLARENGPHREGEEGQGDNEVPRTGFEKLLNDQYEAFEGVVLEEKQADVEAAEMEKWKNENTASERRLSKPRCSSFHRAGSTRELIYANATFPPLPDDPGQRASRIYLSFTQSKDGTGCKGCAPKILHSSFFKMLFGSYRNFQTALKVQQFPNQRGYLALVPSSSQHTENI
ncbi:hypothetical protein MBM_04263 [Drepanopeziza brunnea f. sp. 'multigermtubi' MB_m1]|uniref:Uncharacterized protein n=1 Tax=Marssonina brunnea f. sp. multigermtubi (strain MB_m1) TaxID=1072389 RepID=K1WXV9_MARBU|nr:uncharacterized protein MBM_04263 [Drepanopeziza brunnea f. sp. 'multigermtubi' MB_m1]EKD17402.1 hypothetical protein MBM_04263 [Drepanopeziza brunnea f. sp. 'multigermtubi' MB_m1]